MLGGCLPDFFHWEMSWQVMFFLGWLSDPCKRLVGEKNWPPCVSKILCVYIRIPPDGAFWGL